MHLSGALIGSVLLYSLHIIPISKISLSEIRRFYSKFIRIIDEWGYYGNQEKENIVIREKYTIPSIESRLKFYRLNTYYRLKIALSAPYLNDIDYINNELATPNGHIINLQ